jgi:hypothetical protein
MTIHDPCHQPRRLHSKCSRAARNEYHRSNGRALMLLVFSHEINTFAFPKSPEMLISCRPRDNPRAICADRCKPSEGSSVMSRRTGRSLLPRPNEMVLSLDPPRCFQWVSIKYSQKIARNKPLNSRRPNGFLITGFISIRASDMRGDGRSWKLNRVCYFASDQCVIRRIEQFQKQRTNSRAFKDLTTTRRGDLAERS